MPRGCYLISILPRKFDKYWRMNLTFYCGIWFSVLSRNWWKSTFDVSSFFFDCSWVINWMYRRWYGFEIVHWLIRVFLLKDFFTVPHYFGFDHFLRNLHEFRAHIICETINFTWSLRIQKDNSFVHLAQIYLCCINASRFTSQQKLNIIKKSVFQQFPRLCQWLSSLQTILVQATSGDTRTASVGPPLVWASSSQWRLLLWVSGMNKTTRKEIQILWSLPRSILAMCQVEKPPYFRNTFSCIPGISNLSRSRTTWVPRIVNAYHFFQNN